MECVNKYTTTELTRYHETQTLTIDPTLTNTRQDSTRTTPTPRQRSRILSTSFQNYRDTADNSNISLSTIASTNNEHNRTQIHRPYPVTMQGPRLSYPANKTDPQHHTILKTQPPTVDQPQPFPTHAPENPQSPRNQYPQQTLCSLTPSRDEQYHTGPEHIKPEPTPRKHYTPHLW